MVQELRRRRLTTALIVIPCILLIITLISAWILPSSNFGGLLHRFSGDYGSPGTDQQLVSNPSISNPNSDKTKEAISGKNNDNAKDSDANNSDNPTEIATSNWTMVAQELLDMGIYDEASDFINDKGIRPTGWERPNGDPNVWGPCRFAPQFPGPSEWKDRRRRPPNNSSATTMSPEYYRNADVDDFDYLKRPRGGNTKSFVNGGWCRPGFLIIGAGKCGTSSLYHYLNGHPRVLPAVEKQIHYFKYHHRQKPLEWYYGNFPTPLSFLEHGGLVTGEASPGYLPYPDVARDAYKAWKGDRAVDGAGIGSESKPLANFLAHPSYKSMVPEVPPRIIALGREPFDRIYSSYKYNYVVPTIEYLRTKGHPRIQTGKKYFSDDKNENEFQLNQEDDDFYLPYLFTLEDFVRAELKQLKGCIYDWGPDKTYTKWRSSNVYEAALKLRNRKDSRKSSNSTILTKPLIDLDGICYGSSVSKTVYREQWSEMQTNNPKKVLLNRNLHLTQALIGRSLYVFPLDWWYLNFRPDPNDPSTADSIMFVCTEDLNKVDTLNDLTAKLGLPKYDGFDQVLNEGAYNVGGHRGYDKATTWEELELEKATIVGKVDAVKDGDNQTTTTTTSTSMTNGIPLPNDLYLELKDFIDPMNERLFALTGKRCDW